MYFCYVKWYVDLEKNGGRYFFQNFTLVTYTPLNFNRNEVSANIIFLLARCGRKNNLCYHDTREVLSGYTL